MAIIDVREYFRTRLDSLGYVEWRDGFNIENIPRTLLAQSYHIESGEITPQVSNHQSHEFVCPITISVYLQGYLDPVNAIDESYVAAESILAEILLPANRLGTEVHDIVPTSIAANPLTQQNDNSVLLQMSFNAVTFMVF